MNEREYTLSAQQVLDEQQTTADGLSLEEAARRLRQGDHRHSLRGGESDDQRCPEISERSLCHHR